jgi:hypothetical protein
MANAAKKVLNAMGSTHGPDIVSWVEDQLALLDQHITQWGEEDPRVWECFKEDIDRSFKDVHTKDTTIKELMNLWMT